MDGELLDLGSMGFSVSGTPATRRQIPLPLITNQGHPTLKSTPMVAVDDAGSNSSSQYLMSTFCTGSRSSGFGTMEMGLRRPETYTPTCRPPKALSMRSFNVGRESSEDIEKDPSRLHKRPNLGDLVRRGLYPNRLIPEWRLESGSRAQLRARNRELLSFKNAGCSRNTGMIA